MRPRPVTFGLIGMLIVVAAVAAAGWSKSVERDRMARLQVLVNNVIHCEWHELADRVAALEPQRSLVDPLVNECLDRVSTGSTQWLRLTLARHVISSDQMDQLVMGVLQVEGDPLPAIPVHARLQFADHLAQIAIDDRYSDQVRRRAVRLFCQCASGQTDQIVEVALEIDRTLLREMVASIPTSALEELRTIATQKIPPDLQLPVGSWDEPSAAAVEAIERADGMVADRFAFCQTMTWSEFVQVDEAMRLSGYRPYRVRPYGRRDAVAVAAAWMRDGLRCRIISGVDPDDVQKQVAALRDDGFAPVDVAAHPHMDNRDDPAPMFSVTCVELPGAELDRHELYLGVVDHRAETSRLSAGSWTPLAITGFERTESDVVFSGVWRQIPSTAWRVRWSTSGLLVQTEVENKRRIHDIALVSTILPASPETYYLQQITAATEALRTAPQDTSRRSSLAHALAQLDRNEEAIEQYTLLIAETPSAAAYGRRAAIRARLGDRDAAEQDLDNGSQIGGAAMDYYRAQVEAAAGDPATAAQLFEQALAKNLASAYNTACGFAILARKTDDTDQSARYTDRAVELLEAALDSDFTNTELLNVDRDLDAIREHPGFVKLVELHCELVRYAVATDSDEHHGSVFLRARATDKQLEEARRLVELNYSPVSLSAIEVGPDQVLSTFAWIRPELSGTANDRWARRRARAAAIADGLGNAVPIEAMIGRAADPALRSYAIDAARNMIDVTRWWQRYRDAQDVGAMRDALLVVSAHKLAVPTSDQDREMVDQLLADYRRVPDSGVHAALRVVLRNWGAGEQIEQSDRDLAGPARQGFSWYVNDQNQTMVFVDTADLSPPDTVDPDLPRLPWQDAGEFEIMDREITIGQYGQFLAQHPEMRRPQRPAAAFPDDLPQSGITWYEAAAYCIWLNRQHGVPVEQWPYLPDDEQSLDSGILRAPDHLARVGYRLPTNAEWEAACRAGTASYRFFGDGLQLFPEYVWCSDHAGSEPHPVGSLLPNSLGLFDTLGNVSELCEPIFTEPEMGARLTTFFLGKRPVPVRANELARVLGGSIMTTPLQITTSRQYGFRPGNWSNTTGFRVARTRTRALNDDDD